MAAPRVFRRSSGAAAILLLLAGACGGKSPSGPAPAPAPSATVAAVPTPTPPPLIAGYSTRCSAIGYGSVDAVCGSDVASELLGEVEEAITTLITERRDLFDFRSPAVDGGLRIVDHEGYYDGVLDNLGKKGLCAARSYNRQTVQVKRTNAFSETFVISSPRDSVRLGPSVFAAQCAPAEFPLTAEDAIYYIRVSFYGIECPPGVTAPLPAFARLPLGCSGFVTATPKDHHGNNVPSFVHGREVSWRLKTGDGIVAPREQPSEPFNHVLQARKLGGFSFCADVKGVEGCLDGRVIQ